MISISSLVGFISNQALILASKGFLLFDLIFSRKYAWSSVVLQNGDVIDNSLDSEEDKNEVKNVIYELKEANTKSSIRSAYNKLTTVMSNHITIGTAILTSNILPVLNQLVM